MKISTTFGRIIINGKEFTEDVLIDASGTVRKRPKHISANKKSQYGHTPLTKEELIEILRTFPETSVIIIGNGQYGAMPVEDAVVEYAKSRQIEVILKETPDAIREFQNLAGQGKKVLGIFHITC